MGQGAGRAARYNGGMLRRRLAALAALALLAACGDDSRADDRADAPAATASTSVRVTYDPDGAQGASPARTVRLTCPSERRAAECRRLRSLPRAAFRPVEPGAICTEIFGGPQTGAIRGTVRGRRVDARYKRTNGCEDARYLRVERILKVARRR